MNSKKKRLKPIQTYRNTDFLHFLTENSPRS